MKFKRSQLLNSRIFSSLIILLTILNAENPRYINFAGIDFLLKINEVPKNHYIIIHGDENTAKLLLNEKLSVKPGMYLIIDSKTREVPLYNTRVDPNRLFSRAGSRKALRKFKPVWEKKELEDALNYIDKERHDFFNLIFPDSLGVLIALHNNLRGYNLKHEIKNSRLVSIKDVDNLENFILCTSYKDYEKIVDGPFNVILQDEIQDKDDGSLSWAALKNGVRYINIETRLGWLSSQRKMLNFVEKVLN